MKKLLIVICLLCFSLPSYASFGYVKGEKYEAKPYDNSKMEAYAQKLKKEYWDRVHRGECEINESSYVKYVDLPLVKYMEAHPIDYTKTTP